VTIYVVKRMTPDDEYAFDHTEVLGVASSIEGGMVIAACCEASGWQHPRARIDITPCIVGAVCV
jgi:hypothetical protein